MKTKREIGQFYKNSGDIYFLCQTDYSTVALISLDSANRWEDPVEVKSVYNINSREWEKITGGEQFEQIQAYIKENKKYRTQESGFLSQVKPPIKRIKK